MAFIAAIMEPVDLPPTKKITAFPSGQSEAAQSAKKPSSQCGLNEEHQLGQNRKAEQMYKRWEIEDVMVEEYLLTNAEYVITAIGTSARICRTVINSSEKTASSWHDPSHKQSAPSRTVCLINLARRLNISLM